MSIERPEDERLAQSLRRLNEQIADGCALELACASGPPGSRAVSSVGPTEDRLVLLGILRSGDVAVVPVESSGTRRQRLLSLSNSIAECAMLLGLGTSIYAAPGD